MRILEIIAFADPASGGPIEGLLRHAEIWTGEGHVCEAATLDLPDAPFLAGLPIRVHALGSLPPGGSRLQPHRRYGYQPGFVPWLKQHLTDYDAVIVNGLWNYSTFGARQALAGSPVPYFVFSHGMMDPWFSRTNPLKHALKQAFWLVNEGPLLNNARAVLFTTDEERLVSRGVFRPYRVREAVVGYGTSDVAGDPDAQIAAFRQALPALGDRPFLLFLSRIHRKKGCDLLVEAFTGIAAAHPDLDLVMAGPDPDTLRPELEAIAAAAGLAGRLHWPGLIGGDVKWGAFRACRAFVLPSHQENFGVAVAEALACGRPVLISDRVNIWREIAAGSAGLVAPDTAAGTRDLLARFLALSPEAEAAMAAAARPVFLDHFHVRQAADRLLQTIETGIRAPA